eukprot:5306497-Prymnesium_polylepis.3
MKLAVDGVFASDVIDHFAPDLPLHTLIAGEKEAHRVLLDLSENANMMTTASLQPFRDALIHVALHSPPPFTTPHNDDAEPFNVLIVDRLPMTAEMHRNLVLHTRPSATVATLHTVEQAIRHLRACEAGCVQIHLVLTGLNLDPYAMPMTRGRRLASRRGTAGPKPICAQPIARPQTTLCTPR